MLRIVNTVVKIIFLVIMILNLTSCSTESNTSGQGNTVRIQSGSGKEELLQWLSKNMKYASFKGFMEKREEQINTCVEKKIVCKWIIGSGITNSHKGYIISFKDNEFTIDEFPAGSESDYGITDKDIYFKTR
jgi:maltose-binding protein MalE